MSTQGRNVMIFPPGHPAAPPDGLVLIQDWNGSSEVPIETTSTIAVHREAERAARLRDLNAFRLKCGLPPLARLEG